MLSRSDWAIPVPIRDLTRLALLFSPHKVGKSVAGFLGRSTAERNALVPDRRGLQRRGSPPAVDLVLAWLELDPAHPLLLLRDVAATRARSDSGTTWAYTRAVIAGFLWPSCSAISRMGVPSSSIRVASP
jgi:hypothetical protein